MPTPLKIAKGNPGKRDLEVDPNMEPHPDPMQDLSPPDFLQKEAKEEWEVIAPHLLKSGLLTVLDKYELSMLCQSFARWVKMERELSNEEFTGWSAKGTRQINPLLKAAWGEMNQLQKYLVQFGMSPSSRAGMFIPKNAGDGENTPDAWKRFAALTKAKKSGTLK